MTLKRGWWWGESNRNRTGKKKEKKNRTEKMTFEEYITLNSG